MPRRSARRSPSPALSVKNKGVTHLLLHFFGVFGLDKIYLGLYTQFAVVIALLVLGTQFPILNYILGVWILLCMFSLIYGIFSRTSPMMYPAHVKWDHSDKFSIAVASIFLVMLLLVLVHVFQKMNRMVQETKVVYEEDEKDA